MFWGSSPVGTASGLSCNVSHFSDVSSSSDYRPHVWLLTKESRMHQIKAGIKIALQHESQHDSRRILAHVMLVQSCDQHRSRVAVTGVQQINLSMQCVLQGSHIHT